MEQLLLCKRVRSPRFLLALAMFIWLGGRAKIIAAGEPVPSVDIPPGIDRKALYEKDRQIREMHEEDMKQWNRWREEERARGEKLLKREEEERLRMQARTPDTTNVDPLLKKAWMAYSDYNNRNRDQVEHMFKKYLENNPASPFAPEVYYRIGTMYSNNRNPDIGETFNRQKRDRFFRKALIGYGETFSVEADAARSFLVGPRDVPIANRLGYYEWLIRFNEKHQSDKIYPVNCIEEHVLYGDPPAMTQKEMASRSSFLRRFLRIAIPAAERMILRRVNNPAELKLIAERFPDRPIGITAKKGLKHWQDKQLNFDQVINSEEFMQPLMSVANEEISKQPTSRHSELAKNKKRAEPSPSAVAHFRPNIGAWWWSMGACVLIVGTIIVIVKSYRRRISGMKR